MKIQSIASAVLLVLLLFSVPRLNAQKPVEPNTNKNDFDKNRVKENMKKDGISDANIERWTAKRNLLSLKEKNIISPNSPLNQVPSTCGDMGVENGIWGEWKASIGDYSNGITTFNATGLIPSGPRFNLTTFGGANDGCTPGGGGPPIQVVAPGFGNVSIQLGEPRTTGADGGCNIGCVERLTYPLLVTAADTNFIYSYAIVLENPIVPHTRLEVPYAEIYILDGTDTVRCSHQKYIGDTTGTGIIQPGFYAAKCPGPGSNGMDVVYKPWTTSGVNLAQYINRTLTVVITNADCGLGGHFCHSYWDFLCGNAQLNKGCSGTQATVCAPAGNPDNPFTYTWYLNGALYTGLPNAVSQCITPVPIFGDTFSVCMHQASGCNFYRNYAAVASVPLQSLFTYSANANIITFSDLSTGATQWAWNFGDGNTSTQQNPVYTYTASGTYNACLTVTSKEGCRDTVCKVIKIGTVGVKENDLSSTVSVFPSPASESVFLDFGGKNFGKTEVSVINMVGEKLHETSIPAIGKQRLDVSKLSQGIYFLEFHTNYGITVKKIVISK